MHPSTYWKRVACTLLMCAAAAAAQSVPANIHFSVSRIGNFPTDQGILAADFGHAGSFNYAWLSSAVGVWVATPGPAPGTAALSAYRAGANPDQVVTADFDNDGNLDLAVENRVDNRLSIFLGNGDGSFHNGPDVVLAGHPRALVAANFDHDGNTDLAVIECSNQLTCSLNRYKGNGNGTFTAAQTIALPGTERLFTTGLMTSVDFNKDGNNDVALVANNRIVMLFTSSAAGVLSLRTQFSLPARSLATAIAWASLDQQTPPVPDLAIRVVDGCLSSCGYTNSAYVFLNDGAGHFRQSARLALPASSAGGLLGLGDMDGDQVPDLIVVNSDQSNQKLQYSLGKGNGAFGPLVQTLGQNDLAPGWGTLPLNFFDRPRALSLRDLNGDGRLDIALQNSGPFFLINQNAAGNCIPPSTARLAARICAPATGAVAAGQAFTLSAAGASPAGVKRLELWANGKKLYETWSEQMRHPVTLASGTYRITVIAVDVNDSHAPSDPVTLTVH